MASDTRAVPNPRPMTDASDAKTPSRASGASQSGGEPPKRELEQAPLMLRKASVVLMCGAALPWMTSIETAGHMPWPSWFGAWVLTFIAGWLLLDGTKARYGAKANGISKALAGAHPMGPAGAAVAVFLGAVIISLTTAVYFNGAEFFDFVLPEDTELELDNKYPINAILEFGTLFLALATFAHITAYEYGGKFNPIFPLMFVGPAVAGVFKVLEAGSMLGDYPLVLVGVLGAAAVGAGGIMAIYTMYVTMKEAKVQGDLKKEAARERKRAEREARRSS